MKKFIIALLSAFLCSTIEGAVPSEYGGIDGRILGGKVAPENEFSYQASLKDGKGRHKCGAVIISKSFLLTACHCVDDKPTADYSVVVGSKHISTGGTKHKLSLALCHENYTEFDVPRHDIALLKVAEPIKLNDQVKTISVETQDILEHKDALVSGWGSESRGGPLLPQLHYSKMKLIPTAVCQKRFFPVGVPENQICTFSGSDHGACTGDGGGPLVLDGNVIGLVSWGRPCGAGYPDVYTKLSAYVTWIFTKINLNI